MSRLTGRRISQGPSLLVAAAVGVVDVVRLSPCRPVARGASENLVSRLSHPYIPHSTFPSQYLLVELASRISGKQRGSGNLLASPIGASIGLMMVASGRCPAGPCKLPRLPRCCCATQVSMPFEPTWAAVDAERPGRGRRGKSRPLRFWSSGSLGMAGSWSLPKWVV